jgi:GTP-binding protein EngB required for normal cell division
MKSRADLKNQQVGSLLTNATASVIDPAPSQLRCIQRLDALRQRLATDRFQLAVLGQFKRGKSTLLNALIGTSVLPTAVVPLTAIPTFVEAGTVPCVRSIFASGAREEFSAEQPEQLADPLAQLVTEEANPNNRLGLARVEVSLPVPLLESGVVLIDTPGVGSTFSHNTERAEAVLPECDAALFVVSPDPPITEVEISYLARIQATVARLIIVLNKIDSVESQDLTKTVAFLREVLAQKAAFDQIVPLFLVSARTGLRAKMGGDKRALSSSGLPELEAHLRDFLAREKRSALEAAIALKANTIIEELLMETEIRLQALRLPREDLSQRITTFDSALAQFDNERRIVSDLLAGDRERTLEQIEKDAEELRLRARIVLEAKLDRALARSDGAETARNAMLPIANEFFEAELGRMGKSFQERLTAILDVHWQRMNELIELVRRTAANLMSVTLRITKDAEALEFRHEPYWVLSGQMPTLSPIAPGTFDSLLPASVRKARVRRRLRQEIDTIVQRNVENLRWATRQNVEDAFRRFGRALDETFATNIEATRGIIAVAYDRRLSQAERTEPEIAAVEASKTTLMDIQTELRRLVLIV